MTRDPSVMANSRQFVDFLLVSLRREVGGGVGEAWGRRGGGGMPPQREYQGFDDVNRHVTGHVESARRGTIDLASQTSFIVSGDIMATPPNPHCGGLN